MDLPYEYLEWLKWHSYPGPTGPDVVNACFVQSDFGDHNVVPLKIICAMKIRNCIEERYPPHRDYNQVLNRRYHQLHVPGTERDVIANADKEFLISKELMSREVLSLEIQCAHVVQNLVKAHHPHPHDNTVYYDRLPLPRTLKRYVQYLKVYIARDVDVCRRERIEDKEAEET